MFFLTIYSPFALREEILNILAHIHNPEVAGSSPPTLNTSPLKSFDFRGLTYLRIYEATVNSIHIEAWDYTLG